MLQFENGFYLILIIFKYENYTVLHKRNEQVWARPLCAVTDKNTEKSYLPNSIFIEWRGHPSLPPWV